MGLIDFADNITQRYKDNSIIPYI